MASARGDAGVLLHGELFRGGDARDLAHFGSQVVAFSFEVDTAGASGGSVEVDVALRLSSGRAGEGQFDLERSSVTVKNGMGEPLESLQAERRRQAWRGDVGSAMPAWIRPPDGLRYRPAKGGIWPTSVVAVSLVHFLPQWGIERRDARSERLMEVSRYLSLGRTTSQEDADLEKDTVEVARAVLKDPAIRKVSDLNPRQRSTLRMSLRGVAVPRAAREVFEPLRGDYRWRQRLLPSGLETGLLSLRALARRVRYLGPLRMPPQFVYAPSTHMEEGSVGTSGEFTAAELYRRASTPVVCPDPDSGEITEITLRQAVERWLRHMGVLESVTTAHRAKIGHYLYVRPAESRRYLDLTSVGVGASQLLPVVVQALLSPPGSVLILEQPELHLHPKVQSRLGDFFLAMAKSGRQCLVETHSEHIINRIRLRAAESETEDVLKLAQVYFAEHDGKRTNFRPVRINTYGSIDDWPKGFFDESVVEAERILVSSLRKRSSS